MKLSSLALLWLAIIVVSALVLAPVGGPANAMTMQAANQAAMPMDSDCGTGGDSVPACPNDCVWQAGCQWIGLQAVLPSGGDPLLLMPDVVAVARTGMCTPGLTPDPPPRPPKI